MQQLEFKDKDTTKYQVNSWSQAQNILSVWKTIYQIAATSVTAAKSQNSQPVSVFHFLNLCGVSSVHIQLNEIV